MTRVVAYKLQEGDVLADGAVVEAATITERNEWLTTIVHTDRGVRKFSTYDIPVEVSLIAAPSLLAARPQAAACEGCERTHAPGDRYWLHEDGSCLCDACRYEDLEGDAYDQRDHGHPYAVPS